jgi:HSP20 family protein
MLDDFFSDGGRRNLAKDTFKLDVEETEGAFTIQADLAGVKREEIGLEFEDGKLTISVRKEENTEKNKKNYIHRERHLSSMARSVYLRDARAEGIKARLEDGILSIVIEKEQKVSKMIPIDIN